jgi:hypothetical protein
MEGYEPQRMLTIPDLKGDMHLIELGVTPSMLRSPFDSLRSGLPLSFSGR